MLRDVEIVSSLASIFNSQGYQYKLEDIREMWRTFLIDQFHDVLPGTSIGLVYKDTRLNSKFLTAQCVEILIEAFKAFIGQVLGREVLDI